MKAEMIRLIRINTANTVPMPIRVFRPAFAISSPTVELGFMAADSIVRNMSFEKMTSAVPFFFSPDRKSVV